MSTPTHVAVSAHRDGFRRAGHEWTIQPRIVAVAPPGEDAPADGITAGQLEQLERDPNIAVVPTTPASAEAAEAAPDALAAMRAAHLRTATALAPDDAPRTGDDKLTVDWLAAATGLDGVTAAERDAAAAG